MKLNGLNKVINRAMKKTVLKVSKHAPEILMAAGVGFGVASTVCACKATIKAKDVLEEAKNDLDTIDIASTIGTNDNEKVYTEEDHKRDLVTVYARTGIEFIKLYAPSILLSAASIACLIGSHGIMRNRVATLVTAYSTLDAAFRQYRERVAETFGTDKELETYHGVKQLEEGRDEETGLALAEPANDKIDGYTIYARCFDEYNPNWKDNAEYNLGFLRSTQKYLNCVLERDGYLTLNDAYKELGFEPTPQGQLVGWIYDPDNPNHKGDNYVSFGLYGPEHKPALGEFINGYTNAVWIDFNVDGVIIDKIG